MLVVVIEGYWWWGWCSGGGGGDSPCKDDCFNNCRSNIVKCMLCS